MNDRAWLPWRDVDFVEAARRNRALLDDLLELEASAPAHFEVIVRDEGLTGRAARFMLDLDQASRSMFASLAAKRCAKLLHELLPYGFEGPFHHHIADVEESLRRGFWSCADTAAAAAAVFIGGRWPVSLCTETVDDLPEYAHVRLVVARSVVEPWPEARMPEARGCTLLDDVSALLREQPM